MANYRHLSADPVILSDGEAVLIKRSDPPQKGQWVLPGGTVENGETARRAAEREALEETGLEVESKGFVGLFDSPSRDERGNVSAAYLCRPTGEREPEPLEEAARARKFPVDDLPEPMGFDHRVIVETALDKR